MTTKKKIWICVAVFVFITIIVILYSLGQIIYRLERVNEGLASPDFPYRDYTMEELGRLYPHEKEINEIPTTRTPEETHKLFMDYLKKEDFKNAAECCFRDGDWEEMEGFLYNVKEGGYLDTMISDLEIIEGDFRDQYDTASYNFLGTYKGVKIKNEIKFIKNSQGIWLMERF